MSSLQRICKKLPKKCLKKVFLVGGVASRASAAGPLGGGGGGSFMRYPGFAEADVEGLVELVNCWDGRVEGRCFAISAWTL